jgi:glutathione S-transferase
MCACRALLTKIRNPSNNAVFMPANPISTDHILYSFRRCPYAMRARMAIRYSQCRVQLREVALKNKPDALIAASAKATVPVLVCGEGQVIDESLDIIHWALQQSDRDNWRDIQQQTDIAELIETNDTVFKTHLDHYKYADRYPEFSQLEYRKQGEAFLQQLEQRLHQHTYLVSDQISLADVAIFPFIRQFAHVDIGWFDQAPYPRLRAWLYQWMDSTLFQSVMQKYTPWQAGDPPLIF